MDAEILYLTKKREMERDVRQLLQVQAARRADQRDTRTAATAREASQGCRPIPLRLLRALGRTS